MLIGHCCGLSAYFPFPWKHPKTERLLNVSAPRFSYLRNMWYMRRFWAFVPMYRNNMEELIMSCEFVLFVNVIFSVNISHNNDTPGALLERRVNFNPSMNKYSYAQWSAGWNYLFIYGCTIDVCDWICNFTLYFPSRSVKVSKRGPCWSSMCSRRLPIL